VDARWQSEQADLRGQKERLGQSSELEKNSPGQAASIDGRVMELYDSAA
jgi:hypothetical protein